MAGQQARRKPSNSKPAGSKPASATDEKRVLRNEAHRHRRRLSGRMERVGSKGRLRNVITTVLPSGSWRDPLRCRQLRLFASDVELRVSARWKILPPRRLIPPEVLSGRRFLANTAFGRWQLRASNESVPPPPRASVVALHRRRRLSSRGELAAGSSPTPPPIERSSARSASAKPGGTGRRRFTHPRPFLKDDRDPPVGVAISGVLYRAPGRHAGDTPTGRCWRC